MEDKGREKLIQKILLEMMYREEEKFPHDEELPINLSWEDLEMIYTLVEDQ
jgi:hypothetical protein